MVEIRNPAAYSALTLVAISVCLILTGAGRFSVESMLGPRP